MTVLSCSTCISITHLLIPSIPCSSSLFLDGLPSSYLRDEPRQIRLFSAFWKKTHRNLPSLSRRYKTTVLLIEVLILSPTILSLHKWHGLEIGVRAFTITPTPPLVRENVPSACSRLEVLLLINCQAVERSGFILSTYALVSPVLFP